MSIPPDNQPDNQHSLADLENPDEFQARHIGPGPEDRAAMLAELGYDSLSALVDAAVPPNIRSDGPLELPPGLTETATTEALRALADRNKVVTSLIGMGYYDTITPAVIRRNVLENPAWYTRLHPVSAGDFPGPPGGADQLPDHGHRPVCHGAWPTPPSSTRGNRRSRGHDAAATAQPAKPPNDRFVVDADTHPPDHRRGGHQS